MEQKIRIGAVSYLNTQPMIYGLETWDEIELTTNYPSHIAKQLIDNEIDIGLVPVAIIPHLQEHYFITNLGIGCTGNVLTVALFSQVPINEITSIYLDYQSNTSVQLIKILCKEYWNIDPIFVSAESGFEDLIKESNAAVVIGDRTFAMLNSYKYIYDLGEAWQRHTNLPFVFARWISNNQILEKFINEFEKKIKVNISAYFKSRNFLQLPLFQQQYLQKNINYLITSEHEKGLELFLSKLN